jgi:hypothetical protein
VVRVHFAPRIRVGRREKAALAICWINSKVAVPSSRSFHPKVVGRPVNPRHQFRDAVDWMPGGDLCESIGEAAA